MSQYVAWTQLLTVHVSEIDHQHKELYKRLNDLLQAVLQGKGKDEVGQFVSFLADYTVFHFGAEEKLMQQHHYPEFSVHKKAHEHLTQEVGKMLDKVKTSGSDSDLVVSVLTQLSDWIGDHIGKMDKRMGEFLKTRI